jgi:hypothetical protein
MGALPSAMGRGAINFVSQTDDNCWLVSSGPGPAPWPQGERLSLASAEPGGWLVSAPLATRPVSREEAMFSEVVDNRGQAYQLKMSSSGSSSSGAKRERWDLRLFVTPTPEPDVQWLRFTTPRGTVTAALQPACVTTVSSFLLPVEMTVAEFHLHRQLHQHVWLHLLDPDRPLARLAVIGDALRATAAVRFGHPLVGAVSSAPDRRGIGVAARPTEYRGSAASPLGCRCRIRTAATLASRRWSGTPIAWHCTSSSQDGGARRRGHGILWRRP